MPRYSVGGLSAATAATADHVAAALWNPASPPFSLWVVEIRCSKTVATLDNHSLRRITTQGTAGSSVTPDITNNYDNAQTPPSAPVLGLGAYSAQPTIDSSILERTVLPAAIGSGYAWVYPVPIVVPPGTGLAIATPTAVILQPCTWTFIWDEVAPA